MVLGPSLGAFLGSAFFACLCAYILLNLARDKKIKRSPDGLEETVENNVKHKFLQLILWGLIIVSLIITGASVTDMSSKTCEWHVVNETTNVTEQEIYVYGNNFTDYHWDYASNVPNCQNPNDPACAWLFHTNKTQTIEKTQDWEYECVTNENRFAVQYQNVIYFLGVRLIGFYVFIYFVVMLFTYIGKMKREKKKQQGR